MMMMMQKLMKICMMNDELSNYLIYKIKSKFIAIYDQLCPSNLIESRGIAQDISHLLFKC